MQFVVLKSNIQKSRAKAAVALLRVEACVTVMLAMDPEMRANRMKEGLEFSTIQYASNATKLRFSFGPRKLRMIVSLSLAVLRRA